jgi:hypothetical protein
MTRIKETYERVQELVQKGITEGVVPFMGEEELDELEQAVSELGVALAEEEVL